ncbi:superoxide dismutase [Haloferula sargassicola]|uniref:Superoxide dismutase n=1 Tax=Haloferula sargassicola TaxID=490096 RepID=A0ABP9UIA9_9BACT
MSTPLSRRRFNQLAAFTALAGGALPRSARAAEGKVATLPDLPYAFDALAPAIDAQTMEIHHDKHHAGYVAKLNDALAADSELAARSLDDLMAAISGIADGKLKTAVRNNGGGHWNHTFFWETMAPAAKSGQPGDKLAKAIDSAFGSMDEFKTTFGEAAGSRFGSGWAWLIAKDGKLAVVSTPNQDNPRMTGIVEPDELGTPILGIDVWEHAYYLKYQNRRADYVTAWWNIVNWDTATQRYEAAMG